MNIGGYALGLLFLIKFAIRKFKGYSPPRWDYTPEVRDQRSEIRAKQVTNVLAFLSVAILTYCFISAINPYATYHRNELRFEYHSCIKWLPHSFDSNSTWPLCWSYLALACSFWAIRDWLLGKTNSEARAMVATANVSGTKSTELFPARLRRLLWLLTINGGLLALEGIAQRLEGSGKLLFLITDRKSTRLNSSHRT